MCKMSGTYDYLIKLGGLMMIKMEVDFNNYDQTWKHEAYYIMIFKFGL